MKRRRKGRRGKQGKAFSYSRRLLNRMNSEEQRKRSCSLVTPSFQVASTHVVRYLVSKHATWTSTLMWHSEGCSRCPETSAA